MLNVSNCKDRSAAEPQPNLSRSATDRVEGSVELWSKVLLPELPRDRVRDTLRERRFFSFDGTRSNLRLCDLGDLLLKFFRVSCSTDNVCMNTDSPNPGFFLVCCAGNGSVPLTSFQETRIKSRPFCIAG